VFATRRFLSIIGITVQPGAAMTVKEMGPVRRALSPALFMFVGKKLRG
jgi:hypothetical protein